MSIDTLSKLDIYTIPGPAEDYNLPFVVSLFNRHFLDQGVILADQLSVIFLMDWNEEPNDWLVLLSSWIRFLRVVLSKCDDIDIAKSNEKCKYFI